MYRINKLFGGEGCCYCLRRIVARLSHVFDPLTSHCGFSLGYYFIDSSEDLYATTPQILSASHHCCCCCIICLHRSLQIVAFLGWLARPVWGLNMILNIIRHSGPSCQSFRYSPAEILFQNVLPCPISLLQHHISLLAHRRTK